MCIRDRGDTVIVHTGTYKEGNIIVDKTMTLMGMDWPVLDGQLKYEVLSVKANHVAVSYTHLRAHETVLDLVCRLLLEKKQKKQQKNTNKKTQTQLHTKYKDIVQINKRQRNTHRRLTST